MVRSLSPTRRGHNSNSSKIISQQQALIMDNNHSDDEKDHKNNVHKNKDDRMRMTTTQLADKLNCLSRPQLVSLAWATIQASDIAAQTARQFLQESQERMERCVRCHGLYDPLYAGPQDCQMERHCTLGALEEVVVDKDREEEEDKVEDDDGDDNDDDREVFYKCRECGEIMSQEGYGRDFCWSGRHISSWEALLVLPPRGDTDDTTNRPYWGDSQHRVALELKRVVSVCTKEEDPERNSGLRDETKEGDEHTKCNNEERTRKRKHPAPDQSVAVSM